MLPEMLLRAAVVAEAPSDVSVPVPDAIVGVLFKQHRGVL